MSVAISVQSLSKRFILKDSRPRTLRESFVRRLTGQYDPVKLIWALKDVSFELRRGQTLGILGHNGAGKSTLLRLMCGIGRPTTGTIRSNGPVNGLLQLSPFHPLMTGRENVRTAGMLSGLTRRQMENLEERMIAFAELEEFIDQPVRTYSDGMLLRLSFSAAVHFDPEILVIDEILSVGDIRFQQKCQERLRAFRRSGKTLVLTSHEIEKMKHFCDEVLVLEEGRLAFHSDPDSAIKHYQDLMRQRTEKRAAMLSGDEVMSVPQPEHGSRTGTQEATITGIRICNENGNPVQSIASGSALVIDVAVLLVKSLPDFAMTVGIFTDKDVKCFEVSLPAASNVLGPVNGCGRILCRIPALPLSEGRYFVHVGIYPTDWQFTYDYHWQMHEIQVTGPIPNVTGILSVRPTWSPGQQP